MVLRTYRQAYGRDLTRNATEAVTTTGRRVVGTVANSAGLTDFSSFVVQAGSSGAEVVGLANYSADLTNFLKSPSVDFMKDYRAF